MNWTADQIREAMAILMDCVPGIETRFDGGYEIVRNGSVWIGDYVVDIANPRAVIYATAFDGWWMQGGDNAPGKDYRGATDEEVEHFLKAGLKFRMKPQ